MCSNFFTRELGIGIVPWAPLGSGFFGSGPKLMDNLGDNDFRKVCAYRIQYYYSFMSAFDAGFSCIL